MRRTTLIAARAAFLLAAPAFAQNALKTAVDGTLTPHAMPKLSGGIEGFSVGLRALLWPAVRLVSRIEHTVSR
jgi:polar amino acid transport system substrate-binding protein